MIKMMIVDDEQWIIDGLKCQADWRQLDVEIVCEAENGLEAKRKMQIYQPDIVLTDVSMPLMNGLALCEYIQNSHPFCVVVIMSGYTDFDYARKAIQFGVSSFITKPVDGEELRDAVRKAAQAIRARKALHALEQQTDYAREDMERWALLKAGQCLPEGGRMFSLELSAPASSEEREYMTRFFRDKCACFLQFPDSRKFFLGIYSPRQAEDVERIIRQLRHMKRGLDAQGNIVLGNPINAANGFDNHVQHLGLIMDSIRGIEKNAVVVEEEFNHNRQLRSIPYAWAERLVEAVSNMDEPGAQTCLNEMETFLRESMNYEHGLLMQRLLSGLDAVLQRCGTGIERLFSAHIRLVNDLGAGFPREKELMVLKDGIGRAVACIRAHSAAQSRSVVQEIKEFIDQNYARSLSLNMLAQRYYIAPPYLSKEFKKRVGVNLNRYIRRVRLHHAALLLSETELKTADISMRVGYDNPNYFMKLFREDYQMTPSDYRKTTNGKIIEEID